MSITTLKLTKRALETLPPPANGKQQVYRDADVRQLYVYRYALSTSFVFDTTHRYNRHSAPDLGINLPIALTQYLQNDLLVSC